MCHMHSLVKIKGRSMLPNTSDGKTKTVGRVADRTNQVLGPRSGSSGNKMP